MPAERSKALHFDSWKELLRWLPQAGESQLMTVFVWTGEQAKLPPEEARSLSEVRKEAFEQLVSRARDPLRRYLERRLHCRDAHLVEDVVQEVFIQLYRRAEQYDPNKSFWGWLYRIAHNKHIDLLRRTRPGDLGLGRAGRADEANEEWLQQLVSSAATPERAALDEERRDLMQAAIERLPGAQREIVRLKLEGVQGKEIALQIGKSQAYVSQSYHEALDWVRDQLED